MDASVSEYYVINPTATGLEEYRDALVQQIMNGEEWARKLWYETYPGKRWKEKSDEQREMP